MHFGSSLPSANEQGENAPSRIVFPLGWGDGPVFEWYNTLPNKWIKRLQIRKDASGAVPHRFIMVHMGDDCIHRFDRRPVHAPGERNMVDVIVNNAVASEDTYIADVGPTLLHEIEQDTHCEIELALPDDQVDLLAVISACYAISKDVFAQKYTFLKHNCFFFSWTVLMVVSRHHLPYEMPQPDSILTRFECHIERLTSFIVDEAVALLLDLVIETMTILREKAGPRLRDGMNPIVRILWTLPIGVIRSLYKRLFTIRLHLGLRKQLMLGVSKQLRERVAPVYASTMATYAASDLFDSNLWIEGVREAIKPTLREEVSKILWDVLLEAVSAGLGDITPEQLARELTDPHLKFSFLGKNTAQTCAVWNAALHGGLPAAKGAAQGHSGNLSDGAVFDKAWFAARDAALVSAQTVVKNTSAQINNPKRDKMWELVWSICEETWVATHKVVRPRSLQTAEKIFKELIDTGVETLVQEMKDSKDRTIEARISKERKWRTSHFRSSSSMTNAKLQEYMQNIIKSNTLGADALLGVNSSMARVWTEARKRLQLPDTARATTADNSIQLHPRSIFGIFN